MVTKHGKYKDENDDLKERKICLSSLRELRERPKIDLVSALNLLMEK